MVRIHWVAPHFYPETGGMENHILEVGKRLVKRGNSLTVHAGRLTTQNKELSYTDNTNGIFIKRYDPSINLGYYMTYWKPGIYDCDIILTEGYPSLINDYVVKNYGGKYPIISFSLGCAMRTRGIARYMKSIYDRHYGLRTLRKTDKIISLTVNEYNWLIARGIDPDKIYVVPAGVPDMAFKTYSGDPIKDKYGLDRYILFIGRMYHEKRPMDLLRAVARLDKEFSDLGVVFIGPDAGETPKILRMAKNYGIHDKTFCLGKVSEITKYNIISNCEMLVLPSQWESFGIVLLEGMAQGKPVIGTNVGGVPYLVSHELTGLLYSPGNIGQLIKHIEYLLRNPAISEDLGYKGYQIARDVYTWDWITNEIENHIKQSIYSRHLGNKKNYDSVL